MSSSDSVLDDILAAAESLTVSELPSARSPGAVLSPVGRVSTRRGGDIRMTEGTVPPKLFSVIGIDCSDLSYCFGVIGNHGVAFCIKKNCPVKSHASIKMSFVGIDESYVFIRRNIPGSVFSEPKLSTDKIPVEVMTDWDSKYLSITDWSTEFQAIDGTVEALTSAEEIQTESDFLIESSLLRTPGKRKKDSFAGEEFEGDLPGWKNPRYERTFPQDLEELETLIEQGVKKGVLSTTVSKIETYMEGMGFALEESTSIHHDRLCTLEDNLEVMIGMMQTLKSRIGSSVDIGERFTAPTLWGSTAFIADDLAKVAEDMNSLQERIIKPMQESMASLTSADVEIASKTEKVVRAVKLLLSRVQAVNESVQEIKTDMVIVRAEQSVRFSTPESSPADEATDELMDYINTEEADHSSSSSRERIARPSVAVVSPNKTMSGSDAPEDSVMSILSKLIEDVKTLQTSKQNTHVKFGGLGISDLSDCTAWVEKHFSGHHYGLIMDPLLMLDRIYGEDEPDGGGGLLKGMDLQFKMKIASGSEAAALNALKFARPRVFHKGRPTIVSVRNKSRLNVIDTYAAWNPGGDGVKDYVIEKMNLLEDSISDQIGNTFEAESTAHWIASKCLTATVSFLNQLFGCIEAIYKRLFNFSKFTTEQAWSLTTQVLDRILADLYSPKDNIAQSLKTRNTPANCAQVLFAAFKTHDIMASYVAHKFENHPSVSTEYVKFLATNSGSEKVEKLSSSLEEMKTAMKELKSKSNTASEEAKAATVESKNAGKKADAASSRFSDILKQLETLSAKVKNLEKK